MSNYFPYNPKLKAFARKLRKESTLSEVLLWKKVNKKQIMGYDFDRQVPIGEYIVDFFCEELKLAIEIDGSSHWEKEDYDERRIKYLESLGIFVLRFSDRQVKDNLAGVVEEIWEWVKAQTAEPRHL